MRLLSKVTSLGSAGSALALLVFSTAPAMAASSFGDHLWQFVSADGTTTANVIDFNKGLSRIFDAGNLTLTTDNNIYLDAPDTVFLNNALSANSVFTRGGATITQNLAVGSNETVGGTTTSTGLITGNGGVASDVTRLTVATGSFQSLSGDLTLQVAAGSSTSGNPKFQAGVMGNLHGDTLTATSNYNGGVIGAYSVTGTDASTYPKGGVLGVIGSDGATTGADGAFVAVLDGDGGVVTGNAAYGVDYLNSTPGSHFSYGLDLMHAAHDGYAAVTYGTADIRLQNGETISNSTAGTIGFGSADLLTTGLVNNIRLSATHVDAKLAGDVLHIGELTNQIALGSASSLTTASGAVDFSGATSFVVPLSGQNITAGVDTCTTAGQVTFDTANSHFFGCDGTVWQQLDNI